MVSTSLTILLTETLAAGMNGHDRRHDGLRGIGITVVDGLGVVSLAVPG